MKKKYSLPEDLYYNKNYSWARINGNIATIGVIEPAANMVNYFVYAKVTDKGTKINRKDTYVSLEAVKWTGHLTSPLSGKIIEVNEDIIDDPSIINSDPYGKGWIIKLEMSDKDELKDLLRSDKIKEWVEKEVMK